MATAAPAGSLAAAIASADKKATVLDDRMDAEEHAEFLWLRAHQLSKHSPHRVVIGTDVLPSSWNAKKMKFADAAAAQIYLHHFYNDHFAMHSLQKLADSLDIASVKPMSKKEVLATVSGSLVSGFLWVIELPKSEPKSRFITKTDPSAFAPLNPKFGTKVDFAFIATLEGDQWLRGYVPINKAGRVIGRSGMTLASGFDLGQWNLKELQALALPPAVLDKIKPFAAPHNFKGLTKAQVAQRVGKTAPVPVLTKEEADACDSAVFGTLLKRASDRWESESDSDVPAYKELPSGWQTVWLSRVYQGKTGSFNDLALSGKWKPAITALRSETDFSDRVSQEADLLEEELPAPPPPPPKPQLPGANK